MRTLPDKKERLLQIQKMRDKAVGLKLSPIGHLLLPFFPFYFFNFVQCGQKKDLHKFPC